MKKLKIVLVEDDEVLSKVLGEELKESGFDVFRAFAGDEGLKLAKSKKPNLILLDLMLPKMHGFEVLTELKKDPEVKDIPVMILTMLGSDDDIKKGLSLGANDYVVKSQHAVGEIVDKIKDFFSDESHPAAKQAKEETETKKN